MSIIGIDRAKVGKLQDLNKMYNQTKKSYKFWTKVEKLQNLNNDQNVAYSCLFHLLVQKLFLPRSNFFEHVQYFLNTVKFFDHGQKQDFTL